MAEPAAKSPWWTMWTNPRETIREIVATNPKRSFFWLASIYALQSLLYFGNFLSLGLSYHFFVILLVCLVLSPFIGTILFYIYGTAFYLSGKWLGGDAPMKNVVAAFAWSIVPITINLILWVGLLIFSFEHVFIQYTAIIPVLLINFAAIVTGIWVFVLLIQSTREIQGFSVGRSIGTVLIGYILGFVFFMVVSIIISFLVGKG